MKIGQLVTRDRKHIKPIKITPEQYLWDQLQKHTTTDPLEDIPKSSENQAHQAVHTPQKMDHVQINQHMGTKQQTM